MTGTEGTWIDWQCLLDAAALLARCRYTLQYTYPYAYYMEPGPRKELVSCYLMVLSLKTVNWAKLMGMFLGYVWTVWIPASSAGGGYWKSIVEGGTCWNDRSWWPRNPDGRLRETSNNALTGFPSILKIQYEAILYILLEDMRERNVVMMLCPCLYRANANSQLMCLFLIFSFIFFLTF